MRRFVTGWMVALIATTLASAAWAGNQEVAQEIAKSLRQSGKMQDYKIGVKYQQGTVWLVGRVASEQQLTTALNLVMQSPKVERVVNNLSVTTSEAERSQATLSLAGGPDRRPPSDSPVPYRPEREATSGLAPIEQQATPKPADPRGMTAAERLQRAVDGRLQKRPTQPANESEAANEVNRADRLPASFEPVPAQPTSATQARPVQPTPAQRAPAIRNQPRVAQRPVPVAYAQPNGAAMAAPGMVPGGPRPMYTAAASGGVAPARYDQPRMPNYAWPSYAAYPNYAAVTYPKQYSPTAWPYIGPFYPYPQVPLGWRKVTLEWDNGWWMLDFKDR